MHTQSDTYKHVKIYTCTGTGIERDESVPHGVAKRQLRRQVCEPVSAVEAVQHRNGHKLQELWGERPWALC
jgi:hypothetical protein